MTNALTDARVTDAMLEAGYMVLRSEPLIGVDATMWAAQRVYLAMLAASPTPPDDALTDARDQLRNHQEQADMHGERVTVSRQALDEVLAAIDMVLAASPTLPELKPEGCSCQSYPHTCHDAQASPTPPDHIADAGKLIRDDAKVVEAVARLQKVLDDHSHGFAAGISVVAVQKDDLSVALAAASTARDDASRKRVETLEEALTVPLSEQPNDGGTR